MMKLNRQKETEMMHSQFLGKRKRDVYISKALTFEGG
jgi:hypothetical protein